MAVLCGIPTNTVFGWKCLAISNRRFPGPTRVLNANGISIASAVFAGITRWQTDTPTDRPRYSVGNNRRHLRSTAMWSNNNCRITRLLDWFPCFYRRTKLDNRRKQTSLRPRCGIARLTIYFLNLSPVNAKLTSLSYSHQYIFLSSATYTVAIVTPTA